MAEFLTTIEEVTDPEEIARSLHFRRVHQRNEEIFQRDAGRIYRECRGSVVIVAGGELFVAADPAEAWAWAHRHHPDDRAPLVRSVPKERGWRVYAARG